MTNCAACSIDLPPNSKFCNECGDCRRYDHAS